MDPLSVSMAIVGLLTAAQQISSAIGKLVSKSKSAPKDMQNVKSTVDTIRAVLLQLQMLLLGRAKVESQRTSLILVDQVVITLSACVSTFSELDVFVGTLGSDNELGLMDRIRWATKSKDILEHLQKLEMHKSSLTLMMTILTWQDFDPRVPEDAVDELSLMIRQVLDNHHILAQRLLSIEVGMNAEIPLTSHLPKAVEHVPETIQRNAGGFAFEEVLANSWVYKRSDRIDDGAFSAISSAGRTASWSMLSGLSLSDNISIIAVQALPVYAYDLSNSDVYQFGEFNDSKVELKNEASGNSYSSDLVETSRNFRGRLSKIAAGLTAKMIRKTSDTIETTPPKKGIFGVSLTESITYANVAISLIDEDGKAYIYGYVPIIVAKIGVYLKEKGCFSENIFAQSGSATRVRALEVAFDTPTRYGKGLDWSTGYHRDMAAGTEETHYDVYDAATCFLRYLKLLPEPVIPSNLYEQFTAAINDEDSFDEAKSIKALQEKLTYLPPLNRQLLLYLLDILAVFASKSEVNGMTSKRLVAAFQPALLSKPPREMSAEDHVRAADTMEFMVHNQDHFWIGMSHSASNSKKED
ncbi:Rho-GTPase-activating 5 [Hyphodiscus hymeniophilus]|uniref:Rho-GTPase-activating 5 n=1 Tax=Hyphodiscus hymeniophilus TaxID=353542 RepID=A0A9P6SN59_9HELO|nr:Rho-GTPase-activating 5 [Hyphodiscus hymeniophilus]